MVSTLVAWRRFKLWPIFSLSRPAVSPTAIGQIKPSQGARIELAWSGQEPCSNARTLPQWSREGWLVTASGSWPLKALNRRWDRTLSTASKWPAPRRALPDSKQPARRHAALVPSRTISAGPTGEWSGTCWGYPGWTHWPAELADAA